MTVLIILGHPRKDSFCAALAREFCSTLTRHHIEFRVLILADLAFDVHVRHAVIHDQPLEPDLEHAREAIAWADHLVFVYPIWWGTMPALLKGFLDRILLPGFAFHERESGSGYEGLLLGKSAQLLTTMDTPPWVVRFSGLPDREADKAAGKRTLAVKLGPQGALAMAMAATVASALLALTWGSHWPGWAAATMVIHAVAMITMAAHERKQTAARRIDALLVISLSYILWFVVAPLLSRS